MILNSLEDLEKKGIYKITNLKNKKIYVGSTSEDILIIIGVLKIKNIKINIFRVRTINMEIIILNLK